MTACLVFPIALLLSLLGAAEAQTTQVTANRTVISCTNTTLFRCGLCQVMQQTVMATRVASNSSIVWQCFQCGGNYSNNSRTFAATLNTTTLTTIPLVNDISSGCTSAPLSPSASDGTAAYVIFALLILVCLGATIALLMYFTKSKSGDEQDADANGENEFENQIEKQPVDSEKENFGGPTVNRFYDERVSNEKGSKMTGTFRPERGDKRRDTASTGFDLARSTAYTSSSRKPPGKNKVSSKYFP